VAGQDHGNTTNNKGDNLMSKCAECGLWKEQDGGFVWVEPSDCHEKGGHYMTRYNDDGEFDFTDKPWQVGSDESNLTAKQMAGAMPTKGWRE
jgi:hypothetical protein